VTAPGGGDAASLEPRTRVLVGTDAVVAVTVFVSLLATDGGAIIAAKGNCCHTCITTLSRNFHTTGTIISARIHSAISGNESMNAMEWNGTNGWVC
jgi:nitrite reductase/ring-hydroxylating ferredoxin subunit